MLSEENFAKNLNIALVYFRDDITADLIKHDREQRAEIEQLKLDMSIVKNDYAREFELSERLKAELAALREATRVRDARTEPPTGDIQYWNGDFWEECGPSWLMGCGVNAGCPYYLPMPPAPKACHEMEEEINGTPDK